MRHQSPQTGKEEEDQARDQDTAKSVGWTEHRCAPRRCQRQSEQDTESGF
jgi:hypothetical protein